ncbi:uncharacterized protein [Rutidosis leptorrhynchoides]|uniref:uncharacterized protein n=1 Tax=Rutidosis leptorrhynchoides TaxID=125765 RepID=UPI003A9914AA
MLSWNWFRHPSGRSLEELNCIKDEIAAYEFSHNGKDEWKWSLHGSGHFHTSVLTELITMRLSSEAATTSTLRNNFLPQKVEIFVWQVLKNRLSVRTELEKRGIDLDSTRCPICENHIGTLDHTLLHCSFALEIWGRVHC